MHFEEEDINEEEDEDLIPEYTVKEGDESVNAKVTPFLQEKNEDPAVIFTHKLTGPLVNKPSISGQYSNLPETCEYGHEEVKYFSTSSPTFSKEYAELMKLSTPMESPLIVITDKQHNKSPDGHFSILVSYVKLYYKSLAPTP